MARIIAKTRKTQFGAKVAGGTSVNQIAVLNALGMTVVRPPAIVLSQYNGTLNRLEDFFAANIKCITNICSDASKDPLPFPTDLVNYRNLLRSVFTKYGKMIKVAVIENEPTTDAFYSGPIEDYIAMLPVAVEEAHLANVLIADGCTHVEFITQIINTNPKNWRDNVKDVYKIIQACKTIDLDFMNIHTHGVGGDYPDNQIINAVNYLKAETGKRIMMNEFHTEGAAQSLINEMIAQIKQAGLVFAMIYGGDDTTQADAINIGTLLTKIGTWYRDAAKYAL